MARHGGGPATRPGRMGLRLLGVCIQIACLIAPGLSSPSVAPSGPGAAAAEVVSAAQALHQTFEAQAQRQCFNFSLHQSVAREDFEYPDANGVRRSAKKGALLTVNGRGVMVMATASSGGWRALLGTHGQRPSMQPATLPPAPPATLCCRQAS